MLGGGNPVAGSNPSGTGIGLSYIGDHAYAYSGAIGASSSAQTLLQFNTGNSYIVGKFMCCPVTNFATVDGAETSFQLSVNGEIINIVKFDNNPSDTGGNYWIFEVLLPAFSEVKMEMDAATSTSTYLGSVSFVCSVYQ